MSKPLINTKKIKASPSFISSKTPRVETDLNSTDLLENFPPPRISKTGRSSSVFVENRKYNKMRARKEEHSAEPKKSIDFRKGTDQDDTPSTKGEDLLILESDPIFHILCPKDQFKKEPQCNQCGKQFNKLKLIAKKHCKFCGVSVCEEHSKKRRPNPQNKSKYVRICDGCEEKYIMRLVLQEFESEMQKRQKKVDKWERRLRDQQSEINDFQRQYNNLLTQKNSNEKFFQENEKVLNQEIEEMDNEIRNLEKESESYTRMISGNQQRLREIDVSIRKAKEEYEQLVEEDATMTLMMKAINQDLERLNKFMKRKNARDVIVGPGTKQNGGKKLPILSKDGFYAGTDQSSNEESIDRSQNHYSKQRLIPSNNKYPQKDDAYATRQCSTCNMY